MQQEWVVSRHGYRIACRNNWDGQNQVAIVCHGFGSSKNSPMVQALDQPCQPMGSGYTVLIFPPTEKARWGRRASGCPSA